MPKFLLPLGALGVLLIALYFALTGSFTGRPETPVAVSPGPGLAVVGTNIGDQAPNFSLRTLEGKTLALSDFAGKPVMIDFWTDWCPFCRGEFPEMEKAYRENRSTGFVIIGVHRTNTEKVEVAKKFIADIKPTFPILLDEKGEVYDLYSQGKPFMPLSIFIDREGVIRAKLLGPKSEEKIRTELLKIL